MASVEQSLLRVLMLHSATEGEIEFNVPQFKLMLLLQFVQSESVFTLLLNSFCLTLFCFMFCTKHLTCS